LSHCPSWSICATLAIERHISIWKPFFSWETPFNWAMATKHPATPQYFIVKGCLYIPFSAPKLKLKHL
jgi:hypothetical protein